MLVAALAALGLAALGILILRNGLPLLAADPQASRAAFGGLLFDLFRWLVPPAALTAVAAAVVTGRRRDRRVALAGLVAVGGLELLLASRALPLELAVEALLVAYWAGIRPSPGPRRRSGSRGWSCSLASSSCASRRRAASRAPPTLRPSRCAEPSIGCSSSTRGRSR